MIKKYILKKEGFILAGTSVTLDNLLDKSRKGQSYIYASAQYENMRNLLQSLPNSQIIKLEEDFRKRTAELKAGDFDKLHVNNGGIVSSGDDGFYMDFAGWVIAQGSTLFKDFKKQGHKAVIDYIRKHKISSSEYRFESMIYVFDDALTEKAKKEKVEKWKTLSLDSTQLSFVLNASVLGLRVFRLLLATNSQPVGYRIVTSAPRGMSNTWCFDIDSDVLDSARVNYLESKVVGNLALYELNDLYVSKEEKSDGVLAANVTDLKLIDRILKKV